MFFLFCCIVFAYVFFFIDIGVISGSLPFLTNVLNLSTNIAGCIVGSMIGGASICALYTCIVSQTNGKKRSLLLSSTYYVVGAVLTVFANSTKISIIARIIIG